MAIRIYIIPARESLINGILYRAPKYLGDVYVSDKFDATFSPNVGLENIDSGRMDYGLQPVYIVIADVTPAQNTILSSFADVLTVPANLDNTLSAGAVTTTQNFLSALHIPENWINTSLTYREVIRKLMWIFQFMQRLHGLHPNKLLGGGVTLASTFGSLSAEFQQALINAATSLGFSTAGLQSSTTLRTILKALADQFGNNPFPVLGVTI